VNTPPDGSRDELERIARVADMLCSGHSDLRDRYLVRALALDLAILSASTWLVALSFVEPKINVSLTPFAWDPQIWIGMLGAVVFFLSVLQLKTDWKGRADAHRRTSDIYAEVKRETRFLLSARTIEEIEWRRILAKYDMATSVGIAMPETEFLAQKRRHRIKVEISRHLDQRPSTSIAMLRIRFWFRDNFK
jgi:hypothetical protein